MKAHDLKQYIIENNKIISILESIGCHHIKEYSKYISFGIPDSSNYNSASILKDTLKTKIFSTSKQMSGDIYSLIMDIKNIDFISSLKHIHKELNLVFDLSIINKDKDIKDILQVFKKVIKSHRQYNEKIDVYDSNILTDIILMPYLGWVQEGIMPNTQREFGIGYDINKNRICIPWKYWCGSSHQYVGIMGRTLNENYKILGIPKYLPIISFPKSQTLYGLQENYKYIQEKGEVIIFEAEKSVLKCHSIGIKNTVALGCHELSDEQIKILLSLDVNIIINLDNDMDENLSIQMCNRFKIFRKTGYIRDKLNILGEKDSCIDKGYKVFKALYKRVVWVN